MSKVSRNGQESLWEVEKCGKPIVAAINGVCVGGGLEVSHMTYIIIYKKRKLYLLCRLPWLVTIELLQLIKVRTWVNRK